MARAKKTEEKKAPAEVKEAKPDFGTGMTRINNMLKAGYKIDEIMGGKKDGC